MGSRRVVALLGLLLLLGVCSPAGGGPRTVVQVVDETGAAVAGARLELDRGAQNANELGQIQLDLGGPELAVVSASGFLPEPVALAARDDGGPVTVRLTSDGGGRRWVLHAAGDVMLGRRYETPDEGDPLVPAAEPGQGALRVVAAIRRAFAAANLRILNLETVVSDLPPEKAYPGKRFILNTRPGALEALRALQVDLAILANNHARDYLDLGVAETRKALDARGLRHIGASDGQNDASQPIVLEAGGVRVGVVAFTTLDGAFVNDAYPRDADPMPADVTAKDAWLYEPRQWQFAGGKWKVPPGARRIGEVWRQFQAVESTLDASEGAAAWRSMTEVYPELQDWAAQRGHGGAALFETAIVKKRIGELRATSDLVMVQLHSGFQFQEASSRNVQQNARAAIDMGADLVIAHHPHVLQGADFYKGKLIVYSLGNFIFDQDFLDTFPSAFVRLVFEGARLLDARLVPVELHAYRPSPSAAEGARRTLLRVWERSQMAANATRDPMSGAVRAFEAAPDEDTRPVHVRARDNVISLVPERPAHQTKELRVGPGETVEIGVDGLLDPRLGAAAGDRDLLVGRDLFGWGHFEDVLADGERRGGLHWALEGTAKQVTSGADAGRGRAYLRLRRSAANKERVVARPVANVSLRTNRLYQLEAGMSRPLDPVPSYSVRGMFRLSGTAEASLRLDLKTFDDSNPSEDPESRTVAQLELPLPVRSGGGWQWIELPIPDHQLEQGGLHVNMIMTYVRLAPPPSGTATLDVDELALVEWRPAGGMTDRFGAYEFVRNSGTGERTVRVTAWPLAAP